VITECFNLMLNFIFKNIECIPTASFAETDLVRISKSSFNTLTKQKCLNSIKYDIEKEPYFLADDENL